MRKESVGVIRISHSQVDANRWRIATDDNSAVIRRGHCLILALGRYTRIQLFYITLQSNDKCKLKQLSARLRAMVVGVPSDLLRHSFEYQSASNGIATGLDTLRLRLKSVRRVGSPSSGSEPIQRIHQREPCQSPRCVQSRIHRSTYVALSGHRGRRNTARPIRETRSALFRSDACCLLFTPERAQSSVSNFRLANTVQNWSAL